MKNLNIKFIKQTITAIIVIIILTYFLFTSKDLITKIIIIPFLTFSLAFFLKNIFLILRKKNIAKIMEKIYVIAFFVYYFGFLIYWDYVAINNKDYMSFLFSLLTWFGGIYVAYKRHKKNYKR